MVYVNKNGDYHDHPEDRMRAENLGYMIQLDDNVYQCARCDEQVVVG